MMDNPFDNVKDSSIWYRPSSLSLINQNDCRLYIGIVRSAFNDDINKELRYFVEVKYKNDTILTSCRMLRHFGGVFNYQDFVMQGFDFNANTNNQNGIAAKAGDIVLVGSLAGQSREGIILGGLTHPARKNHLDVTKGPQYRSEFNGVETHINEDGEYTLTFKGQPTNLSVLKDAPSNPIPSPEYDTEIGTSYLKFDKTGSITVSDNAESDLQKLFIDKENGTIELISGKISLKFVKEEESVSLINKLTKIESADKITVDTKLCEVSADNKVKIVAPDIHIVGKTFLGAEQLLTVGVPNDGVVTGVGIDTFTGQPYSALGNASGTVFAKK